MKGVVLAQGFAGKLDCNFNANCTVKIKDKIELLTLNRLKQAVSIVDLKRLIFFKNDPFDKLPLTPRPVE